MRLDALLRHWTCVGAAGKQARRQPGQANGTNSLTGAHARSVGAAMVPGERQGGASHDHHIPIVPAGRIVSRSGPIHRDAIGSIRPILLACILSTLAVPRGVGAQVPLAPGAVPAQTSTTSAERAASVPAAIAAELSPWLAGSRLLDAKVGALAGAGSDAMFAVLDPAAPAHARLGEGPGRIVLLLVRNDRGELHELARNDRLVPCAQCGGIAGDPYSYALAEPGGFTIITEGGSREHWSNAYSFAWEPARGTWTLRQLRRKVTDRLTGAHQALTLTPRDFGTVAFADVDPATLPQVALPHEGR